VKAQYSYYFFISEIQWWWILRVVWVMWALTIYGYIRTDLVSSK